MRLFLSLVVIALVAVSASAALTLVDPAFAIESVLPGWNSAFIAFTKDGTLWSIKPTDGCLYKFVNVSGNPNPPTTPVKASLHCLTGFAWDWGMVATSSDRLFTASGLELTAMKTGGSAVQAFGAGVFSTKVRGIAIDPTTGDLIVAGHQSGILYRVDNPETHATPGVHRLNTDVSNGVIDGVWVGPDGTIYAAAYDTARLLAVSPTGAILARPQVLDRPQSQYGPDGVAVASNNTYVITSRANAQRITKWALPGFQQSLVATTNGYNDYSTVGPDGCMYISSISGPDGLLRLTNSDGTCEFQDPTQDSGCTQVPSYDATGDYSWDSGFVNQKTVCFKPCDKP